MSLGHKPDKLLPINGAMILFALINRLFYGTELFQHFQ